MNHTVSPIRVAPFGFLLQSANRVGRAFTYVMTALAEASEGNRRAQQAQALFDLSDEALAKRGLKREEIVQHVFRGMI